MIINNLDTIGSMISTKIEEPKTKNLKKLKESTEEFEAIFLKLMLDEMDKTVKTEGSMFHGGSAEKIFKNMLNDERAKDMSKTGSIGLAKILYNQLSKSIREE